MKNWGATAVLRFTIFVSNIDSNDITVSVSLLLRHFLTPIYPKYRSRIVVENGDRYPFFSKWIVKLLLKRNYYIVLKLFVFYFLPYLIAVCAREKI